MVFGVEAGWRYGEDNESGYNLLKSSTCFQFGVKELWRDNKR